MRIPRQSVLIVGAGAAGMSAAMFLRKRGYDRVVVLEEDQQIGGKCRSLHYRGRNYDLGANLTTRRYKSIRQLAKTLGLELRSLPDRRVVDLASSAQETAGPLAMAALLAEIPRYLALRARTGIDRPGYAGLSPALGADFGSWLDANHLSKLRPLFARLFVAYGYGVMDELSAAHAMKFFDPVHVMAAIQTRLSTKAHTAHQFLEGFQAVWERVAERFEIDVRTGSHVSAIVRTSEGVDVAWEQAGVEQRERFDRLVLACPLDRSLSFLDATAEERDLFGQIEYYDYWVAAAVLEGVPGMTTWLQPYALTFTPGWPTVFHLPTADDPNELFLFYAYGDERTGQEAFHRNLRAVVEGEPFGGRVREIVHTRHWRYFPHVTPSAMQAGYYDRLEALQGRERTNYVGEVLTFPMVELIHAHARGIVEKYF